MTVLKLKGFFKMFFNKTFFFFYQNMIFFITKFSWLKMLETIFYQIKSKIKSFLG